MIKLVLESNGKISPKLLKKCEFAGVFFSEDFNYFRDVEKMIDVNSIKKSEIRNKIAQTAKKKGETNEKVTKALSNFIECCLATDPSKRISAADLISHPFLY